MAGDQIAAVTQTPPNPSRRLTSKHDALRYLSVWRAPGKRTHPDTGIPAFPARPCEITHTHTYIEESQCFICGWFTVQEQVETEQ